MKSMIGVRCTTILLALLILLDWAVMPAHATSPLPAPERSTVDRLTDAIVTMMPAGVIMDEFARKDPKWPMGAKASKIDATRLACIRKEMSTDGYRGFVSAEAQTYADRHESTIESDVVLAEAVAPLMNDIVLAKMRGEDVDADRHLAKLSAQQMLDFMTFAHDPKHADLRLLSGYGDIPSSGSGSKDNATVKLMFTKMTLRAMSKCDISPAQIF